MTETGTEEKEVAQIAYEAYAEKQEWRSYNGLPIPQWNRVRPDIKAAWGAAVEATTAEMVRRATIYRD